MVKLKLTLEMDTFELFFDNENELLKWLIPILVTEKWIEYDYSDTIQVN